MDGFPRPFSGPDDTTRPASPTVPLPKGSTIPLQVMVPQTGVAVVDRVNDGMRFLLERVFEPGVECRRGVHGSGHCDFNRCSRLDAILRFASRNFTHQEQVMAEAAYPDINGHGGDHSALVDHLTLLMRARVCAERDAAKVQTFLIHWLMDHARRCDDPLGRWLQSRQDKDTAALSDTPRRPERQARV